MEVAPGSTKSQVADKSSSLLEVSNIFLLSRNRSVKKTLFQGLAQDVAALQRQLQSGRGGFREADALSRELTQKQVCVSSASASPSHRISR